MSKQEIEELTYKLTNIAAVLKVLASLEEDVETLYISMICADYHEKLKNIIESLQKRLK